MYVHFETYFWIYYLLMCAIGVVVITATIMRNHSSTQRRCRTWNKIAMISWHLGAILFIIFAADTLLK